MIKEIKKDLQALSNPDKAKIYQRFFKTAKGQYGEGDIFIGLTVPEQRSIAKKYLDTSMKDIANLLKSGIHEHRLTALFILVYKYKASKTQQEKKNIYDFYLSNLDGINNWDLVDCSCNIVGNYLAENPNQRAILYKLVKSNNLWERRISIVSTMYLIKKELFTDTIKLSELLLKDNHDLIHKAVGWMLRELGKKDLSKLESFLNKYSKVMPRTMLRYSIERLPEKKRKFYMKK